MKNENLSQFTRMLIDIITDLGHYNLGQLVGILKANHISNEEISNTLYIIKAYSNIINFPKIEHTWKISA